MAFREQRLHAINGVVDHLAFVGPGVSRLPIPYLTSELRLSSTKDPYVHPPEGTVYFSSEIIAPDHLKDHDNKLYARIPDFYNDLDSAPDFISQRLPQLGLIGDLYRRDDCVNDHGVQGVRIDEPFMENPQLFSNPPIKPWFGYF